MPPRPAASRGSGPPLRGGPARDGGASRGGPVGIAAHIQTVGVRRPGYGTGGQVVKILVNAFAATVTDCIIHHYDVDISPAKLPVRFNMQLFHRLCKDIAPDVFRGGPPVYDGRKNAFATYRLGLASDSVEFNVTLESAGSGSRPPKVYKIKLTKVAEINTEILDRFINGQKSQDNAVSTSLMALNVAIRMAPNMVYPFNVRSFFTPDGRKPIKGGMELWRGYFQSLRPAINGIYVNIDVATGVMYRQGAFLDLVVEFFGGKQDLSANKISERERLQLLRFVGGMRVSTTYGGKTRFHTIKGITKEGADTFEFQTRDGGSTSVAKYFKQINETLRFPKLICIQTPSGAVIPSELCSVPAGQIMRKALPPEQTKEVVAFSQVMPQKRLMDIKAGLQVLQHGQSEYVRQFGMNIADTPMALQARVIQPPTLQYKTGTALPRNGAWNMQKNVLYRPATINLWIIVIFESQRQFPIVDANKMGVDFLENAKNVGISVNDSKPLVYYKNAQGDIASQLIEVGKECKGVKGGLPDLIVVVLPTTSQQIYHGVKHFGDFTAGVATQCLQALKCKRANAQYWANVMLKVNSKLGGINSILKESPLDDPRTPSIVMGADVIHPPPGAEGKPSHAALVASVDSSMAKYVAESRVQTGRQEIIEDLEEMVIAVFTKYRDYDRTRPPPGRLIFYRDGVSEGQFPQVLADELPKIQKACTTLKIKPKITLIVVGKRHHIRMFPINPDNTREADFKSKNCLAGTTIDDGIGHPNEFDYYQLSHAGLLGTSRPAHYSVLYDESNMKADGVQKLSFYLCHAYARATRSVSIPAPVYYADIVCSRAKLHYRPGDRSMETETNLGSKSDADTNIQSFKTAYKQPHPTTKTRMYFM